MIKHRTLNNGKMYLFRDNCYAHRHVSIPPPSCQMLSRDLLHSKAVGEADRQVPDFST